MQRNDERPSLAPVMTFGHVQIESAAGTDLAGVKQADASVGPLARFEGFELIATKGFREER